MSQSSQSQETWALFNGLFVSAVNKPLLIYGIGHCLSPNKHTPAAAVTPSNRSEFKSANISALFVSADDTVFPQTYS